MPVLRQLPSVQHTANDDVDCANWLTRSFHRFLLVAFPSLYGVEVGRPAWLHKAVQQSRAGFCHQVHLSHVVSMMILTH